MLELRTRPGRTRSDFQGVYTAPVEDMCIDMLLKPVEQRSRFENVNVRPLKRLSSSSSSPFNVVRVRR